MAVVAINGYLSGWHQAIVFGAGSVIVVEIISLVIRLVSRRHHTAGGPLPRPERRGAERPLSYGGPGVRRGWPASVGGTNRRLPVPATRAQPLCVFNL